MKKFSTKLAINIVLVLLLPAISFAAAPKSDATVVVADSRKFSGWQAWWANLYNESHFWFALITIIILPVAALILGRLASLCMARLGINLRSRELAEH